MYFRATKRFWAKVEKQGPAGCWLWTGWRMKGGYGDFRARIDGVDRHVSAHRWAWFEVNGEIPAGMVICHHCDNPACVNPDHLFLGTQQDNVRDMVAKGRQNRLRGGEHATSKLTPEDVEELRRLVNGEGVSLAEVERRMGIHHRTARRIALGETWSFLPHKYPPRKPRARRVSA
jgi:DNA-binding CsgD family transcriptional regulator